MKNETCQKCQSVNVYFDGSLWICPECGFEWTENESSSSPSAEESLDNSTLVIYDANRNILETGDSVTVIKELRIKGSSSVVKVGTKVKNIRIIDEVDGHNIACKIPGIGSINLKSEYVKKA